MEPDKPSSATKEENLLIPSISQLAFERPVRIEDQMALLAITDDLTGLFNRRYFYQTLNAEIKKAEQSGTSLTLMMIDIDHFKEINDTYGHLRGDSVLAEVGNRLKNGVRGRDIVFRYAGDEFILLLLGGPAGESPAVAERIFKSVCGTPIPAQDDAPELAVALSVGLASYPDDAAETKQLVDKADRALYASKKAGRNRITVFSKMGAPAQSEAEARVISPCPQFIGRKLEMAQISTLLETALKGRGGLLLVTGNSGTGKTRLLVELKKQAKAGKALCLIGRGEETKINLPYYPLLEMLKSYLFSLGKEKSAEIGRLLEPFEKEMLEMMPELTDLGLQVSASSLSPEQKRFAYSQGLSQVFKNISQSVPLVIFIDDLHLVDEATVHFLSSFSRVPQEAPVLIATAFSEEAFHHSKVCYPLGLHLSELKQGLAVQEINLSNLTASQTEEMVQVMLTGFSPPSELVQKIFQATKGNPLFLDETLKKLVADGSIFFEEGQWKTKDLPVIEFPVSIKDAVRQRVERLDAETREALTQAAVFGEDFNFNVLSEVNEKNEGFVLDLVDKAREADLIREETGLSDDRFDFTNHQIREVLYELLDEETKKIFHQRIGKAIEKLFGDNVENFISELAYHYQRSADQQKASEYAQRTAVKATGFYAPEGAPAAAKAPEPRPALDEETFSKAAEFLRFLRTALANFQLYPAGSKMRAESIQSAYGQLVPILDKTGSLTLSEADENLLIEGVELDPKEQKKVAVSAFVALMIERGVKSLTFRSGLNEEEFGRLLEVFTLRPEDIKNEGGIAQVFAKRDLSHVTVNERIYVALGEEPVQRGPGQPSIGTPPQVGPPQAEAAPFDRQKEEVFLKFLQGMVAKTEIEKDFLEEIASNPKKIAHLLGQISTRPESTMQAVSQMAQIAADEDSLRETIGSEITELLAGLDAAALTDLFTQEMPSVVKDLRVRERAIERLSEEKILELVKEIGQQYQNSFRKEYVGKVAKEKVFGLQKLLSELLSTSKGRTVLPKAYPKLVEAGVVKGSAPARVEAGKGATAQAHDLLKRESLALLEEKANQIVPMLVKELLIQDQTELAVKLVDKLMLNAEDKFPTIRTKTFQTISQIYSDSLSSDNYGFVLPYERSLIQRLNEEIDVNAYAAVVDVLEKAVLEHLKREEYEQALELLGLFGRHLDPKSERAPEQRSRLDQTLRNVFRLSGKQLLTDLASENKEIQIKASKLLARLRPYSVKPLIELLETTDDLRVHKNTIEALREIGSQVVPLLLDELDLLKPAYFLASAIEVIGVLGDEAAIESLAQMLNSFDSQVRRKAIYSLVKIEGKTALPKIIGLLKDKDVAISQDIVRIIGIFSERSAVPDLIKLIKKRNIYSKEEDDAIQREACMALGKIKDEHALAVLIDVLERESRMRLRRTKNEEVRAAAAWALGEYADKRALEALKKAVDDPSAAVQVIAQAALVKVESSLKAKRTKSKKATENETS